MGFSKLCKVFFVILTLTAAAVNVFAQTVADYKGKLSVRLYPDAIITSKGGADSLVFTIDLPGTKTLLMLDLPEAFVPVQQKEFYKLGINLQQAFQLAYSNVAKQNIAFVTKVFDVDGTQIEFNFLENEDYAASYALNIATNKPELIGEWGSVIVMPNKGLVIVCKISPAKPVDFVKFIQRIKPITDKSYAEHQNPVSKDFYWYYKGKFTPIIINENAKGDINIIAPLGLGELMSVKK